MFVFYHILLSIGGKVDRIKADISDLGIRLWLYYFVFQHHTTYFYEAKMPLRISIEYQIISPIIPKWISKQISSMQSYLRPCGRSQFESILHIIFRTSY